MKNKFSKILFLTTLFISFCFLESCKKAKKHSSSEVKREATSKEVYFSLTQEVSDLKKIHDVVTMLQGNVTSSSVLRTEVSLTIILEKLDDKSKNMKLLNVEEVKRIDSLIN